RGPAWCSARSGAGLARRRRAGAERRLHLARSGLVRAGSVGHDGRPAPRPSASRAAAHGRGLGRPSAAEGLPAWRRAGPVLGGGVVATVARPAPDSIYEGTRIPSPIPTVLEIDPAVRDTDDILTVNFGPNHPSTHGVLRLIVDLDGEVVVGVHAKVGYVHTGFEKNMEQKSW